jgi:hypothetical protein
MREWRYSSTHPTILNLSTRWRGVVSFTSLPLYPRGKSPWYTLYRRLGGPQSQSGSYGEEKHFLPTPRPSSLAAIPTELLRLTKKKRIWALLWMYSVPIPDKNRISWGALWLLISVPKDHLIATAFKPDLHRSIIHKHLHTTFKAKHYLLLIKRHCTSLAYELLYEPLLYRLKHLDITFMQVALGT